MMAEEDDDNLQGRRDLGSRRPGTARARTLLVWTMAIMKMRRKEVSTGWKTFVILLSRPTEPYSLAVVRILFGVLMMLDIPQERGLGRLHEETRPHDCRFPVFEFLVPLPLEWMYVVYLFMFAGAAGIALGFLYRATAAIFALTYWYVFLLDTTKWNNHSFLFGLVASLLVFTDAHRCWSVDELRRSPPNGSHVPLWNYTLIRAQIFLVYFIAGLKKTNPDWLGGYSMKHLSSHWVFSPFRIVLSERTIDLHVVHHFGFVFDLSIGFFMLFEPSRPFAFLFCAAFNLMNSQMFHIGMFPYVMLATMPIFCRADWPRRLILRRHDESVPELQTNSHCLYPHPCEHDHVAQSDKAAPRKRNERSPKSGRYHRWAAGLTVVYIAFQLFIPYSHFVTQGYNHWSDGLYGYSWDMMVHSWKTQNVRVTVRDSISGRVDYVDPERFVSNKRWTRYARLAQQYARCVERNVRHMSWKRGSATNDSDHLEVYVDVWASLNQRFVQRMFDPRVNLLTADWSPISTTQWTMPLLDELNIRWRDAITRMTDDRQSVASSELTFVADFPGFFMENCLHSTTLNLNDTSLQVLQGKLIVQMMDDASWPTNVTLVAGSAIKIPVNRLHRVHVVSDIAAAYFYRSRNATVHNDVVTPSETSGMHFWQRKYDCFEQSLKMTAKAIVSLIRQTPMT